MAMTSLDDTLWTAATLGWLGERSPGFQAAIRDMSRLRHYEAGEYPHHLGDQAGGIYGVVRGTFGTYVPSDGSGIALAHIFRPGAWFGQGPITSGKPRYLTFRAMEPATVLSLPPSALAKIMQSLPGGEREMMSLSEYNQTIMSRAVADLLIRKSESRVAAVLLRLFEATPDGRFRPGTCRMTQADLSEMSNTSRHTANTVLKSFEARGWVTVSYGSVTLKDARALSACAWP